jgi:hypothetical protein
LYGEAGGVTNPPKHVLSTKPFILRESESRPGVFCIEQAQKKYRGIEVTPAMNPRRRPRPQKPTPSNFPRAFTTIKHFWMQMPDNVHNTRASLHLQHRSCCPPPGLGNISCLSGPVRPLRPVVCVVLSLPSARLSPEGNRLLSYLGTLLHCLSPHLHE